MEEDESASLAKDDRECRDTFSSALKIVSSARTESRSARVLCHDSRVNKAGGDDDDDDTLCDSVAEDDNEDADDDGDDSSRNSSSVGFKHRRVHISTSTFASICSEILSVTTPLCCDCECERKG